MAALLAFAFALAWIFDAPAQEMGPKSWWDAMQSVEGHVTGDLEERFSLDPQGGEPGEPGNPDGRDGSVDVAGGGAGNGSGSGGDDADGSGAGGGQNTDGQGNGAIDPSVPEVAQLIQTWINIAEPPPNAEDGASLTYTNGGRMVGTTTTGTIESRHETGAFDAIYLWTNWRKLDSVDHCTMEEYVTVNLSGKSIAHCRGRYKPKIKDWKGWQAAKARTAVTTLKLKAVFRPGGAAPDGAKAGTVANQEPGPGESLAKGGSVTLKIYSEPIKKVEVPDLRGQQVAAATDTLRAIGLKLNLKNGPAASNEADAGTVFGQTPAAGALVKPGATLTAVVYKPFVPKIFVPEITSDNVAEAMAALSDLGLSPVIRTDPPGKENWEDGTVTGFVPASGSEISPGGTVTIVVTVEEPQMVVVPDLRGLRGQAAREQLVGAGLHAEVRSSEPAREPDMTGTVIRTEPANGADVEIGSLVMVFVFDTYVPPKITVPSVIGMPIAEAENVLEQAGLVASIDSFIQAPDPESSMTIAQASPDPGVAIDKGGTVALIVHGRYSAPKIPVPDVVGLSLSQARSRIEAAGLKAMAGPKSDPGDPELAGTVFALKPPAGTKIDANADVLIMAYGAYQPPKPEPAPDHSEGAGALAVMRDVEEKLTEIIAKEFDSDFQLKRGPPRGDRSQAYVEYDVVSIGKTNDVASSESLLTAKITVIKYSSETEALPDLQEGEKEIDPDQFLVGFPMVGSGDSIENQKVRFSKGSFRVEIVTKRNSFKALSESGEGDNEFPDSGFLAVILSSFYHKLLDPKLAAGLKTPPVPAPAGDCADAIGSWNWPVGTVVFSGSSSGGSVSASGNPNVGSGQWTCIAQATIEIVWDGGRYVDTMNLSNFGDTMTGSNQHGNPITAHRL